MTDLDPSRRTDPIRPPKRGEPPEQRQKPTDGPVKRPPAKGSPLRNGAAAKPVPRQPRAVRKPEGFPGGERDVPPPHADGPRPPEFSEEALALEFADRHAGRLRYVAAWGRWLEWTGTHWRADETIHAFDLVRRICREAAARANKPKVSSQLATAKTVAAVERLAKADRRLAATVDQWDADPWLLNTPTGTVDLRSGTIRPHRIDDYITKATAVAPAEAPADCPMWRSFLQKVTGGDGEMATFLQRAIGYSLVGVTSEHVLFFGFGTGGNGKGVFLNTVSRLLGDYATVASADAFTVSHGDRHPTELAALRGARFVTAQETEEGRRWAESKIKALTGGDPITARFMRQDFFTFEPQFSLWIAGNHKPGLRNVDEAIRRRLHLVPFNVTIPKAERDPALPDKLRREWPAILTWAIKGARDWHRDGLQPPPIVREATDTYFTDEDAIALWLAECCEDDPRAFESNDALFGSWKSYAERAGEYVGTKRRFLQTLESRGFQRDRSGQARTRGLRGISIVRPTYGD